MDPLTPPEGKKPIEEKKPIVKQAARPEEKSKIATPSAKASEPKSKQNSTNLLKHKVQAAIKTGVRYQAPIIMVLIGALLAITALRMLSYSNPAPSDERVQQNISKFKKININPKVVERINQLSDSQTSTGTNVKDGRNNPFSE